MIREDETLLICDLAETYGVLDMRALPLKTVAALSAGLREDSRIKLKLSGVSADKDTLLLAAAVDRLSLLVWAKTKDGEKGRNRPQSLFKQLTGQPEENEKEEIEAFQDAEAFQRAWAKALGKTKEV